MNAEEPDRTVSPSSRGLGHHPFTVSTGVRIPLGMPAFLLACVRPRPLHHSISAKRVRNRFLRAGLLWVKSAQIALDVVFELLNREFLGGDNVFYQVTN